MTDPLMKNGSEGLQVLQLWREKVFKLCVQLRSKDIELRGEKDTILSNVGKPSSVSIQQYKQIHCAESVFKVWHYISVFLGRIHGAAGPAGAAPGQCAPAQSG